MEETIRNVKGTKDYLPQEQAVRTQIRRTLEQVFDSYAYQPLETPILNYYDLLASKYGGGSEILKEVYRLSDQGERELALRYDLTIPIVKVIGMNPTMRLPFKRYEIGKVFRDGPIKAGRFREFTQCDVDLVGISSMLAEAELMTMAADVFQRLNLQVIIQVNNRKVLTGILLGCQVPDEQLSEVILTLDKVEKIGVDGIKDELNEKKVNQEAIKQIVQFIESDDVNDLQRITQTFSHPLVQEGSNELQELFAYLRATGLEKMVRFNPFLARGLNIYTGTVYEIFLADGSLSSSIGSGGRYDQIIGQLLGTEERYPAIGLSFGLDVIYTALMLQESQELVPLTQLLMIPIGTEAACMQIAKQLRDAGVRVELEMSGKRLKKALEYANREKIPYVLILGDSELAEEQVTLRNMREGTEIRVPFTQLEHIYEQINKRA